MHCLDMYFKKTDLSGVFEIEIELKEDERGYFARIFSDEELRAAGVPFTIVQANRSFNAQKGTLRGIHFQKEPFWEAKIMLCISGALFVAIVDLRPDSPTYKKWIGAELSAENKKELLVPKGCANGFQTLEDSTEVLYLMSERYSPEHATGVNYADPQFNIPWPLPVSVISEKDKQLPHYVG